MFRRTSINKFEFEVDGDTLAVAINNFGPHRIGFELLRITEKTKSINLIKIFKIIKNIILSYMEENKKVMIITILFSKNDDLEKWTNICEIYINKYLDPDKWKIKRSRYIINCSKK